VLSLSSGKSILLGMFGIEDGVIILPAALVAVYQTDAIAEYSRRLESLPRACIV
jgi:hypothetical protein